MSMSLPNLTLLNTVRAAQPLAVSAAPAAAAPPTAAPRRPAMAPKQEKAIAGDLARAKQVLRSQETSLTAQIAATHDPEMHLRLSTQLALVRASNGSLTRLERAFHAMKHRGVANAGAVNAFAALAAQATPALARGDGSQIASLGLQAELESKSAISGQPISQAQRTAAASVSALHEAHQKALSDIVNKMAASHDPMELQALQASANALREPGKAVMRLEASYDRLIGHAAPADLARLNQLAEAAHSRPDRLIQASFKASFMGLPHPPGFDPEAMASALTGLTNTHQSALDAIGQQLAATHDPATAQKLQMVANLETRGRDEADRIARQVEAFAHSPHANPADGEALLGLVKQANSPDLKAASSAALEIEAIVQNARHGRPKTAEQDRAIASLSAAKNDQLEALQKQTAAASATNDPRELQAANLESQVIELKLNAFDAIQSAYSRVLRSDKPDPAAFDKLAALIEQAKQPAPQGQGMAFSERLIEQAKQIR